MKGQQTVMIIIQNVLNSRILFKKLRKRGRKRKNKKGCRGGGYLLTYFWGLRFFRVGLRNFQVWYGMVCYNYI